MDPSIKGRQFSTNISIVKLYYTIYIDTVINAYCYLLIAIFVNDRRGF